MPRNADMELLDIAAQSPASDTSKADYAIGQTETVSAYGDIPLASPRSSTSNPASQSVTIHEMSLAPVDTGFGAWSFVRRRFSG